MLIMKSGSSGRRDSSVVGDANHSCIGPKFSSQHPNGVMQSHGM